MYRMRSVTTVGCCILRYRARSVAKGVEGGIPGVSGCEGRQWNAAPRTGQYVQHVYLRAA